jgi:hypothetical protein
MTSKRSATVAFWWFMVVSQTSGGGLTATTQGPFATQQQCEWGRQQIAVTTSFRGTGWGSTACWNDGP